MKISSLVVMCHFLCILFHCCLNFYVSLFVMVVLQRIYHIPTTKAPLFDTWLSTMLSKSSVCISSCICVGGRGWFRGWGDPPPPPDLACWLREEMIVSTQSGRLTTPSTTKHYHHHHQKALPPNTTRPPDNHHQPPSAPPPTSLEALPTKPFTTTGCLTRQEAPAVQCNEHQVHTNAPKSQVLAKNVCPSLNRVYTLVYELGVVLETQPWWIVQCPPMAGEDNSNWIMQIEDRHIPAGQDAVRPRWCQLQIGFQQQIIHSLHHM